MSIELQLLLGWAAFAGTHIAGSSLPVRRRLIRALGLLGFKGLYSLVALATFVPLLAVAWQNRHEGALVYDPPAWTVHLTEALMLIPFLLLALSFSTPSPSSTVMELGDKAAARPRGVQRITRHPMNLAFALFGIAHMISNPTVGDWIFWGGWPVYALLSALHQDRRSLAAGPDGFAGFYRETSLLPFAAILAGRQRLAWRELSPSALLLGVALYAALRLLHPHLIGGFD